MAYTISSQPFYDSYDECYKNILVISPKPHHGPLATIVKRLQVPPLSPFQDFSSSSGCVNAIYQTNNTCELMTPDNIPELFNFLLTNNYKIDTSLTKMMNSSDVKMNNKNLVCFISTKLN